VFAGAFSLEAAIAVCGDPQTPETEVVEALLSLLAKSLVCKVPSGSSSRYRLLDITGAYARGKLDASGEESEVRQRQARYYMEILKRPVAREDPAETAEQVANVRAVLGWAFATEGMGALAIELSAAAASLWLSEGRLAESRRWTREALARLDRGEQVPSELDARIALASSLMYTHGITAESHRNWEIIYQRAKFDGRSDLRLAGLAVLWGHRLRLAEFAAAQRLLDEADFLAAVNDDTAVAAAFHWMSATTAHFRGDHAGAHRHAARIFDDLTEAASDLMRRLFGYDLEVGALRLLGLSHFFLGDVDKAIALSDRALERATALSYDAPLANTLYWQAFMAYLLEDSEEVDRLTTSIIESRRLNALQPAVGTAIAVRGLSRVRRGEVALGREMVDRGLSICQQADYHMMDAFIRAELALQLARQGPPGQARAAPTFLQEPDEESWSSPEVLRITGEISELSGDLAEGEARYLDALVMAERQGALMWGLGAATSLAALWVSQGRAAEAQAVLAPVYAQFSTGRPWPGLCRAADCLEACRRALAVAEGEGDALDEDTDIDGLLRQTGAPSRTDRPGAFDA
jgi:tetratricopeptide (TPR) repeat protein